MGTKILTFLKTKASEKSTYLGIVALLAAFGITINGEVSESVITAILAVVGAVNVILNEKGK